MRSSPRSSIIAKAIAGLALAVLADRLFYFQWIGATLGGFALAWIFAIAVTIPAVRHRPGARIAALVAFLLALILIDNPTLLGWTLFWVALSSAAILARARYDDAFRLAQRLLLHIGMGTIRIFTDLRRYLSVRVPRKGFGIARLASLLALPIIGGATFLALFASANPLIGDVLTNVEIESPVWIVPHLCFAAFAFFAIWPSLRPHPNVTGMKLGEASLAMVEPRFPAATIILSLITFNAIFALQNALDIVFLWSGARLPGTITMADYAHRGAYSLIATALLAGAFVLVAMRPGSPSAKHPLVKLLVTLWVLQNLLLVASSILRTLDYIGSYSLTVLRIQAIAWMVLVGIGLVLICWRLLRGKSAGWLINANAFFAGLTLIAFAVIDPAAIAAQWNVRHAREAGGPGPALDLCYLELQGPSALLPLIELEGRVSDPEVKDRVRAVRESTLKLLEQGQADWHSWTWRGARRLTAAREALGPHPAKSTPTTQGRGCGGFPYEEPKVAAPEIRIEGSVPPPAVTPPASLPRQQEPSRSQAQQTRTTPRPAP